MDTSSSSQSSRDTVDSPPPPPPGTETGRPIPVRTTNTRGHKRSASSSRFTPPSKVMRVSTSEAESKDGNASSKDNSASSTASSSSQEDSETIIDATPAHLVSNA